MPGPAVDRPLGGPRKNTSCPPWTALARRPGGRGRGCWSTCSSGQAHTQNRRQPHTASAHWVPRAGKGRPSFGTSDPYKSLLSRAQTSFQPSANPGDEPWRAEPRADPPLRASWCRDNPAGGEPTEQKRRKETWSGKRQRVRPHRGGAQWAFSRFIRSAFTRSSGPRTLGLENFLEKVRIYHAGHCKHKHHIKYREMHAKLIFEVLQETRLPVYGKN